MVRVLLLLSLLMLCGCQTVSQRPTLAPRRDQSQPSTSTSTTASPIQLVSFEELADPLRDEQPLEPTPMASPELLTGLNLEMAEVIALAENPSVAKAAARVAALEGKLIQAGLYPNPSIGYRGEEIGNQGTAGMQGGYVRQAIVTGGKLHLDQAVVVQELMVAEQQWAAQELRVRTDVRLAYYNALIAQRRVDVAQELVAASDKATAASRRLYMAKEIPRVGVLQTEIEAQNARVTLQQAKTLDAAAWRQLLAVLGRPPQPKQRLTGVLNDDFQPLDWQQQLQRVLTQSPLMAIRAAELERARWALERALVEPIPNINVQVGVVRNNASQQTVSGVQVELPTPLWNRNQGGIAQARADIVAAERNLDQMELRLSQQLADVLQQYSYALDRVTTYEVEILPKARENFELVSDGYDKGQLGNLDILTAQRIYFEASLAQIAALQELWEAKLQLEGLLMFNSLTDGGAAN